MNSSPRIFHLSFGTPGLPVYLVRSSFLLDACSLMVYPAQTYAGNIEQASYHSVLSTSPLECSEFDTWVQSARLFDAHVYTLTTNDIPIRIFLIYVIFISVKCAACIRTLFSFSYESKIVYRRRHTVTWFVRTYPNIPASRPHLFGERNFNLNLLADHLLLAPIRRFTPYSFKILRSSFAFLGIHRYQYAGKIITSKRRVRWHIRAL